jgi:hypothetical protein
MQVTAADIMRHGSDVMDEVEAFLTAQLKSLYGRDNIPFDESAYALALNAGFAAGTKALREQDGKGFHAALVSLASAAAMGAAHQRAASDAFTAGQAGAK